MPKIVDWDARRDEILSATWRVIARDGIARATIRAIAREAGCSRGILAHYFDDKADILGSALVMSHRRVMTRMEARAAGLTGLAALRVIMLEALPLDSERDLEAQIEISFWGRALGNPGLRRLQHAEFDRFAERLHGRSRRRTQAPQQLVEHLLLAGRADPVGVEHPLGAEPVDQDEQLVGGQVDVHAVPELAVLLRLDEMPAQPVGEAVELRVLQPAQRRVA